MNDKQHAAPAAPADPRSMHSKAYLCADRHALIAETAYHMAQKRGFAPGHELEDWLAAEAEVDERLIGEGREF